jgi:SAM-dependent methyltransferase
MVPAGFIELLACPRCRSPLDRELRCVSCGAAHRAPDGIVDLRLPADSRTEKVRELYSSAPFPSYPVRDSLERLRARAGRSEFARLLDQAIPPDARVLEMGCGTGQMSLFLAGAQRRVVGADLTRASLLLAADARRRYHLDGVLFVETDLRAPGLRERAFDVVYSNGVLHHTPDPRASFAALSRLVRPGGIVVVGLYNVMGRLPHRLRRGLARLSGFRRFPFDSILRDRSGDPARRKAWLDDQYLHPEEHRHTLGEVRGWFEENGVEYLRAFPGTLFGQAPLEGDALFSAAEDDWAAENALAQLGWTFQLAAEGGLFLTIGVSRG